MLEFLKNRLREKGTLAAIGSIIAGLLSYFGLDLTVEQNLAVVTVLGIFVSVVTGATKTAKAPDRDV